jgi:hypothetical protein
LRKRTVENELKDVEMQVHLQGTFLGAPQSPSHFGQGSQDRAIDGGEAAQGLGFVAVGQRQGLLGQLADDVAQQGRVKHAAGLAQRAQGGAFAAEQLLYFGQGAGLLESAQASHDGAEEAEQQQADVLIEEQLAIAGLVAGGGIVLQAFEKRIDEPEVFQAVEILVTNVSAAWPSHAILRQAGNNSCGESCAKNVPGASAKSWKFENKMTRLQFSGP